MRQVILILSVKAIAFVKTSLDMRWPSLVKNLASAIIFGGVGVGVFLLARASTLYLLQQAHIGLFLYHRFLSMLLYVFLITVNLGNMIVCYATLYRSEEVRFLMALPVPHTAVFWVKFIDNLFYSSSTLLLLGLAGLLGYGSCFALPWTFYFFTMFFVLIPFVLIGGIVAVLMLMALLRVAARIGLRWLLSAVTLTYLLAIYIYFRITNPMQMVQEVMRRFPNVDAYFGELDAPLTRYLPNHWVAEFLYWSISGDTVRATAYFLILIGTVVGLIAVAAAVAGKFYYPSWASAGDAQTARPPAPGERRWLRWLEFGQPGPFTPMTNVILRRDVWMFFREPSQWLHLLMMFLLLLVFVLSMSSMEMKLTQPLMQTVSYLVVFLFNGFMIASICLRFIFPAVSLEGEAFWSVRSAPVSLRWLFRQKFLVAGTLITLAGEALAVVSTVMVRDNRFLTMVSAVLALFIGIALTGLNLGAGAYFASYREKNPIRIASSQGASLTFLASLLYLGFVAVVLVLPLRRYFDAVILRGVERMDWIILPVTLVGLGSLLLGATAMRIGRTAFHRDS